MKLGKTKLPITALIHKSWMQSEMRVAINQRKVDQYAEEMEFSTFPRPIVFFDPALEIYWVGDGFHRILAHKQRKAKDVEIELKRGTFLDAVLCCIEVNKKQLGLPFTRGDKGRAIQTLLTLDDTKEWSQSKIAETTGTAQAYVNYIVKKFEIKRPQRIKTANGRIYRMPLPKNPEACADRREKILNLYQHKGSQKAVADELELSRATVKRYLEEAKKEKELIPCPHCHGTGFVSIGVKNA